MMYGDLKLANLKPLSNNYLNTQKMGSQASSQVDSMKGTEMRNPVSDNESSNVEM